MSRPHVTVVGLGLMGGSLAAHLASSGFDVSGFDPAPASRARAAAAGVEVGEVLATVVEKADVVLTSLPTPEVVLETYANAPEGILGLRAGQVFVDASTVDPTTSSTLESRVKAAGARFVACPLGKGPAQAASGESPLFLGGDQDAVDAASEVLAAIGKSHHRFPTVQAAAAFKLISNMIGFANLTALCEGVVLARRAGIEPDVLVAALRDTGAMSYQAELRLPWILAEDFAPRFAVDLARKDLRLGVDMAARWAVAVPAASAALVELCRASAAGRGGEDAAVMVETITPNAPR
jgi:3-hydroxyisobutyrate dehydrogenase